MGLRWTVFMSVRICSSWMPWPWLMYRRIRLQASNPWRSRAPLKTVSASAATQFLRNPQICPFRPPMSGGLMTVPGIVAISCRVASEISSPSNFAAHARRLRAAGHFDTK